MRNKGKYEGRNLHVSIEQEGVCRREDKKFADSETDIFSLGEEY